MGPNKIVICCGIALMGLVLEEMPRIILKLDYNKTSLRTITHNQREILVLSHRKNKKKAVLTMNRSHAIKMQHQLSQIFSSFIINT